ncbi:MAG: glycosyltransferase [Bacteroidetes bacterium SW_11_45_7]|nr:MAG: glycosyltransferase [Bacteroidetes bacterium SW_11_45_7]
MDLSIVIPLYNEADSLSYLEDWIRNVMEEHGFTYEVIFIDDGSKDDSWQVINELAEKNNNIKAIRFRRNYGKSAALNKAFHLVEGDVVITMDADLQDNPEEIPPLYRMMNEEQYDIVSGWKRNRKDPLSKTIPSRFFNAVTSMVSGISLHDFNCGLKTYKKDVVKSIEVYGEMHRYIPVLVYKAGFERIGEKQVEHRPRQYGKTKFGLERFINGFLDLLSIMFVTKFGKRPMHLFGTLGVLSFVIGFLILLYLSYTRFVYYQWDMDDRPLFYLGLVTLGVGVQLFLTGFLAEMISLNSPNRDQYLISAEIGTQADQDHPNTSSST